MKPTIWTPEVNPSHRVTSRDWQERIYSKLQEIELWGLNYLIPPGGSRSCRLAVHRTLPASRAALFFVSFFFFGFRVPQKVLPSPPFYTSFLFILWIETFLNKFSGTFFYLYSKACNIYIKNDLITATLSFVSLEMKFGENFFGKKRRHKIKK